jgi:hypothetical protein
MLVDELEYRRILVARLKQEREMNLTAAILLAKGRNFEQVEARKRQCTVTKPDAMAARKNFLKSRKNSSEKEPLAELEQNEDERCAGVPAAIDS